jgi:hypothetical protein
MIKKKFVGRLALVAVSVFTTHLSYGQCNDGQPGQLGQANDVCTITTAVPILTIAPDARSAAMGDAGVAISPDANSAHWNPGKLGFATQDLTFSASYSPWLRKIIDDMSLSYLSAQKKVGENSTFSASLLYFDMGDIQFRTATGQPAGDFNPKEYALSLAYGQRLSENFGVGIGARYIRSNISNGVNDTRPGNTAAVDLGTYYNRDLTIGARNFNLGLGANISNLGGKISYTRPDEKDFIPTNLRLGTAITMELDAFNKITFALDANKLLVPSPRRDVNDTIQPSVLNAIFTSFTDAEGGFKEEMQEINISAGVEYWYNDLFAVRAGYFYENPTKGDRRYLSMGFGIRYQVFGFDGAYLIPNSRANPLADTWRVSIHFNFGNNDADTVPAQ